MNRPSARSLLVDSLSAASGMKTRAAKSEAIRPTITGMPMRNIQKLIISWSLIRISGKKTTTVVSVAMVTASPTSPAPSIEAVRGSTPSCRLR